MKCFVLVPLLILASVLQVKSQVRVNSLISAGMVIQREQKVKIWGTAAAEERVTIRFREEVLAVKANADGKWMALINSGAGGGPFRMVIQGSNKTNNLAPTKIDIDPVYVGEVWLAGGQSNMEYTMEDLGEVGKLDIKSVNDLSLRMIKIAHNPSTVAVDSVPHGGWKAADTASVRQMSAVAYYFAKRMRKELGVPVGIISSNWGGTTAETWVSPVGLRNYPEFAESIASMKSMPRSFQEFEQVRIAEIKKKFEVKLGLIAYRDSLQIYAPTSWKSNVPVTNKPKYAMSLPGFWEDKGFQSFDGIVYLYHKLVVPGSFDKSKLKLSLGIIDDMDSTWVNGVLVGATSGYKVPRNYVVPASAMINKDTLYILVKVTDTGGGGGIYGKEEELVLTDGTNTVKMTNWTAIKGIDFIANKIEMPYTPSSTPAAPSVLYNGMIHPLKNYTLRGVMLYHGTANAYRAAQYHTLFPDWISDLRNTFGNQELPVLYVQLAGFHAPNADCNVPSAWAELREAQRLTLQARTNTAMVVAYDLGEANDIHPKRKMEVGERLWLQTNDLIYKSPSSPSGVTPEYSSLEISNNYAIVKFKNPKGLHPVRERVIGGFCIAGADKKWYAGEAQLKDDVIFVSSPSVPKPVAVRYGWADFPTNANLYSEFNNPVSPFRTDNWPLSTAGNK